MSNFNTQPIAKPSYIKTKAFGLCGTLALATALLIAAGITGLTLGFKKRNEKED